MRSSGPVLPADQVLQGQLTARPAWRAGGAAALPQSFNKRLKNWYEYIHSSTVYLLATEHVPDIVLGTANVRNKIDKTVSAWREHTF